MNDFLLQLFVFLFAAVVCVLISKKMGMGSVLGYLFAGVMIGPYVLKFVGNDSASIMHATEFGVVMMLFLIGLELNPQEFWKIRHKIIGLGTAQFVGTTALATVLAYLCLPLNFSTCLVIGFVVTMSSTAIIMQTISEKGINRTNVGKSSFSILLFQDIIVIPIMAILPLLATGNSAPVIVSEAHWLDGAPVFLKTLSIVGAISILFIITKFVINPLFRSVGKLQIREIYTASALMLVIGVSVLMEEVGLSPALGAFISGVALANNPYKLQLESDIEPFKALLLGIFFIAVGASINFTVLFNKPVLILSLLLGSIVIKGLVLFCIGKWKKFASNQSFLFAILLSQIGEFAFVILALSRSVNLIDALWYDYLLATTALSMIVTPLLLVLNERWISPFLGLKPQKPSSSIDNDLVKNDSDKKIIIAGFGDFGLTIGRMLQNNGFHPLLLDNDVERVEKLRKIGFQVYYGDATSLKILKVVGIQNAKILIAAIDPPSENQKLIDLVKKEFPEVSIFVRAKDRKSAFEYLKSGQKEVYRETFYTAVFLGEVLLEKLGLSIEDAKMEAEKIIQNDTESLNWLANKAKSDDDYIYYSRMQLEEQRKKQP